MQHEDFMTAVDHIAVLLNVLVPPDERKREGLDSTPNRVARALRDMTAGYQMDPAAALGTTFPADGYDEMVVLKGVRFYSLCEHHLLPFSGTVGLAYLPGPRIVGLSKLARVVEVYARRLQVQERMTRQIADAIETVLAPRGVAVVVQAQHLCMAARGVQKPEATMLTSVVRGLMRSSAETRAEALHLLGAR